MTKPETEWVLVPREPYPEMVGAWYRCKSGVDGNADTSDYAAYRAMLAASPPAPSDVVREWEALFDDTAEPERAMIVEVAERLAAALTEQARDLANAEAWADNLQLQLASAKGWEKRNLEAANAAQDTVAAKTIAGLERKWEDASEDADLYRTISDGTGRILESIRELLGADPEDNLVMLIEDRLDEIKSYEEEAATGDATVAAQAAEVERLTGELKYIEGQFATEVFSCGKCGHEEATEDCDSHIHLKDFLAALPSPPLPEEGKTK